MDTWGLLADVLTLVAVALLLGALCERVRQSAIVGYLLAGCLLGPYALGVVDSGREVDLLAELGVALLLFSIGLEVSWERLKACGRSALLGGVVQVIVTAAAGAAVAGLAGLGPRASLLVGIAVALSSTASVLRLLQARTELDTRHGRHALGILLVQDVAVVPLVLLATTLASEGTLGDLLFSLARAFGLAFLMVVAFLVLFKAIIPRLLDFATALRNRDLTVLLALITGLGSALLAHEFGVSPSIGAFIAGLLLAGSPYAVLVRTDVSTLKTAFMTLFFSSVGMLANPHWVADHPWLVLGVVSMILAVKAGVLAGLLWLVRLPFRDALATGVALAQAGEFAFVIVGAGSILLSADVFMLVTSSTILTLLLTQALVWLAGEIAGSSRRRAKPAAPQEPGRGHLLVVGFGPAGQALVESLRSSGLDIEVIDLNPRLVATAKALGLSATVGDAMHPDVLDHAHLTAARLVAVTVPDERVASAITRQVRSRDDTIPVVVRGRYHLHLPRLEKAGAQVVDEEWTVGKEMGRQLLQLLAESVA